MKFSDLKKELDKGKIRNLYIFTGPETEVMRKYIHRISPDITKAETFASIQGRFNMKGLFATTGTYLLEDDKAVTDHTYDDLKAMVGKNTLILVFKDIDKRKKLLKSGSDHIVEFARFSEKELVWYVQKIIDVPDHLAEMIASYSGNDVARIENECYKLKMLGQEITPELVKELIHPPLENRMFEMIDLVAKKNASQAFRLYQDLVELKVSPIQILSVLYSKWKHVFLVQSYFNLSNAELAGKTGLTFFQVNMARALIGAFTLEDILYFMIVVQETEVQIKSGRVDQYVAMEALLVDIFS